MCTTHVCVCVCVPPVFLSLLEEEESGGGGEGARRGGGENLALGKVAIHSLIIVGDSCVFCV